MIISLSDTTEEEESLRDVCVLCVPSHLCLMQGYVDAFDGSVCVYVCVFSASMCVCFLFLQAPSGIWLWLGYKQPFRLVELGNNSCLVCLISLADHRRMVSTEGQQLIVFD